MDTPRCITIFENKQYIFHKHPSFGIFPPSVFRVPVFFRTNPLDQPVGSPSSTPAIKGDGKGGFLGVDLGGWNFVRFPTSRKMMRGSQIGLMIFPQIGKKNTTLMISWSKKETKPTTKTEIFPPIFGVRSQLRKTRKRWLQVEKVPRLLSLGTELGLDWYLYWKIYPRWCRIAGKSTKGPCFLRSFCHLIRINHLRSHQAHQFILEVIFDGYARLMAVFMGLQWRNGRILT